jgi:hypothetical protein
VTNDNLLLIFQFVGSYTVRSLCVLFRRKNSCKLTFIKRVRKIAKSDCYVRHVCASVRFHGTSGPQ